MAEAACGLREKADELGVASGAGVTSARSARKSEGLSPGDVPARTGCTPATVGAAEPARSNHDELMDHRLCNGLEEISGTRLMARKEDRVHRAG